MSIDTPTFFSLDLILLEKFNRVYLDFISDNNNSDIYLSTYQLS